MVNWGAGEMTTQRGGQTASVFCEKMHNNNYELESGLYGVGRGLLGCVPHKVPLILFVALSLLSFFSFSLFCFVLFFFFNVCAPKG